MENLGVPFIRIYPDVENFDLDSKFAITYNHIKESSLKLAQKSLKEKFCKRIIELYFTLF